ncbi:MAG: electron transfer flavoprotein subunit alpha/FixB family protein [Thermodesulfobacteriota bacterium]
MNRDVWVLLEAEDKKIKNSSIALIDEGKRLAVQLGGGLTAVFIGQGIEGIDELVGTHGSSHLYFFHDETLQQYVPEMYERLLTRLLLNKKPHLVLAAATSLGSDLMPRVAAKLKAPLVTNCVEIRAGEDMEFIKPVQNGRLHATVVCKAPGTKMATMDPDSLTIAKEEREPKIADVIEMKPDTEEDSLAIRVTGFLKADHRTIDISEAEIILAIGRGIGSKENFTKIQEFADRIGAAIGGTRPAVDVGMVPFERQIGQTGKAVSPKLIIMCGISGAMEFTKGIENARTKVAINIDRQSRVFKSIDLGIVDDLNRVIPHIIEHIDAMVGEGKGQ